MAFGEKSNGKTYSTNLHCLKEYLKTGHQFVYLRRWIEDIQGAAPTSMFNSIAENYLKKNTKWAGVIYYRRAWYLVDEKGKKDKQPFCYGIAISQVAHTNGSSFPNVKTIIFDEFLTRSVYLPDEISNFLTIISNIVRDRDDCKIILLGNTVNKSSIYFKYFNIKPDLLEQGRQYKTERNGTKLALEYCGETAQKKSNIFFGYEDKSVSMITNGAWECAEYPKSMVKIKPKDILFRLFIIYEGQTIAGEYCNINGSPFLFFHAKKGPLKDPENDIIFSDIPNYRRNWYSTITRPTDKISKTISDLFRAGKVFYSDNNTGEILRNFILYSISNTGIKRA